MARHVGWFVERFVLTLGVALWMLLARWGRQNVFSAIALTFILAFQILLSVLERPECPVLESYPPYRRLLAWWYGCDVLGLSFLGVFEIAVAVAAGQKDASAIPTIFLVLFVPYTLLIVTARIALLRARAMAAYCQESVASVPSTPAEEPLQVS